MLLSVAGLLLEEGLDVTPLLPHLEKVMEAPANSIKNSSHPFLTAALFVLKQDLHDSRAWSFIDQACAGSLQPNSDQDLFIGIVQALAPHCKEAQAILESNPEASKKLPLFKITATNLCLRQHGLAKHFNSTHRRK